MYQLHSVAKMINVIFNLVLNSVLGKIWKDQSDISSYHSWTLLAFCISNGNDEQNYVTLILVWSLFNLKYWVVVKCLLNRYSELKSLHTSWWVLKIERKIHIADCYSYSNHHILGMVIQNKIKVFSKLRFRKEVQDFHSLNLIKPWFGIAQVFFDHFQYWWFWFTVCWKMI